ncbi:hypothetical protein Ae406Ps2_5640 [Pseudonocardia sp. Ae406_Ps2]|nr:hypothetical protein Ae331Ps2_0319c [Pseudonocardia sp. Ae331_Ps2]OLM05640.1 hypothetical protein Ae406Ps2_5640 [Pseudonocardia sp. Ae406_Ps2]OLM15412.1 hypothetical protein Ae505Ps2_5544c [Pseudonocardia sp. Ae505_Ps2]OLM27215.1 hypothetical protein Ae706Ps2_5649 [Pseudonocardia sp. Ae706_Ps2]
MGRPLAVDALIDADREPFEMTRFVMRADSAALD